MKIEDARLNSTEQIFFRRQHLSSRPLVDLMESHFDSERGQESDTITQHDPRIDTPVNATTSGLRQFPSLKRPETEMSSLGFSLPPDESIQLNESKVRGNWELAGELLNTQLSEGLKISPHPSSSKNRSLVRTLSPSADSSASFSRRDVSCSSEQQETKQANSVSLCIQSHAKQTPESGLGSLDANSEWQPTRIQADDSWDLCDPFRCDTAAQPQPSTSGVNYTDQTSLTHESDLEFDEPSYFFWQDSSYDEQYNEESTLESDLRSPSPVDAAFVCPAALSKLMSGRVEALVREGIE